MKASWLTSDGLVVWAGLVEPRAALGSVGLGRLGRAVVGHATYAAAPTETRRRCCCDACQCTFWPGVLRPLATRAQWYRAEARRERRVLSMVGARRGWSVRSRTRGLEPLHRSEAQEGTAGGTACSLGFRPWVAVHQERSLGKVRGIKLSYTMPNFWAFLHMCIYMFPTLPQALKCGVP